MALKAVVSQQLLPKSGGGRVAACEIMVTDYAIANLIREAKTPQIRQTLETSSENGCITMEKAVANLLRGGFITKETADKANGVIDSASAIAAMQSGPKMNLGAQTRPRI